MPGRFHGIGRLHNAGRYNKTELKLLHDAMLSDFCDDGLTCVAALKKANDVLYQVTGQTLEGPFGPGVLDHPYWERESPQEQESPQERGRLYRAMKGDPIPRPRSSRHFTHGNYEGYSDQTPESSRYGSSSRGFDDRFSNTSYHGSFRGSSGFHPGASRPPGWEGPEYDQYFTEQAELQFSRGYSQRLFWQEPRRRDPHEYSGGTRDGFTSSSGGYGGAYGDDSPRNQTHYNTEERRPSGSYGSGRAHESYNDRPQMEPAGVKPAQDLYVVLNVHHSVSPKDLKDAYRTLCFKYHPDREKGGPEEKEAATQRTMWINQAYDVLKDPEMRAFYDRTGLVASKGEEPGW